jgi:hypothetical protein
MYRNQLCLISIGPARIARHEAHYGSRWQRAVTATVTVPVTVTESQGAAARRP